MFLQPGARLGACEILSAIGAGGMGEVYRARDTKLNRDTALKILPHAFAHDPDRPAILFDADVSADGQRFVMVKDESSSAAVHRWYAQPHFP